MMGCNEAGQELTIADTFDGRRKLRPLVPRPFLFPTDKVNSTCPLLHGPDILSMHHHNYGEQRNNTTTNNHDAAGTPQVVVSSRWNPTPEQLRALEELYRCGTRTPSAEQIQHITAQLRRFGKIEGKNVFYWFQNHKARERQKRRREVQLAAGTTHCREHDTHDMTPVTEKVIGANKVCQGVEQNKNLISRPPSTSSDDLPQECDTDAPIGEIEKEGFVNVTSAETTQVPNGWIQLDATEFHHHHHLYTPNTDILSCPTKTTATWQLLKQPSSIISNLSLLSPHDNTNYNLNQHYFPLSLPSPTSFIPTVHAHVPPLSLSPKSLDLNYLHEEIERNSLTLELLPLVKANGAHDVSVVDDGEATMQYNAYPYYKFL